METSLKTGFAQIFSSCQKIWVAQTLGELQPPRPPIPPDPYAYVSKQTESHRGKRTNGDFILLTDCTNVAHFPLFA